MQSIRKYASLENTERRDAIIFRSLRFLPRQFYLLPQRESSLTIRPVWFGGWMLTWATTLESVLNRPSSTSGFDLANHPRVVNAFFIFVPAFFLALSFTLMGIANHYWNESLALCVLRRFSANCAVVADFDCFVATTNCDHYSTRRYSTSTRESPPTSFSCKDWKSVSLERPTR